MTARNPAIPESQYQHLLDCYESGQIEEWAWQQYLEDKGFRAWVAENKERARKRTGGA